MESQEGRNGMKILVLDDDQEIIRSLKGMLVGRDIVEGTVTQKCDRNGQSATV